MPKGFIIFIIHHFFPFVKKFLQSMDDYV